MAGTCLLGNHGKHKANSGFHSPGKRKGMHDYYTKLQLMQEYFYVDRS